MAEARLLQSITLHFLGFDLATDLKGNKIVTFKILANISTIQIFP